MTRQQAYMSYLCDDVKMAQGRIAELLNCSQSLVSKVKLGRTVGGQKDALLATLSAEQEATLVNFVGNLPAAYFAKIDGTITIAPPVYKRPRVVRPREASKPSLPRSVSGKRRSVIEHLGSAREAIQMAVDELRVAMEAAPPIVQPGIEKAVDYLCKSMPLLEYA